MIHLERMWINQPSSLQQHHNMHGTNVLASPESQTVTQIFFLSGPLISQQISPLALSKGWCPSNALNEN